MIELMKESSGRILGVRASGRLTETDYKHVLIPRLESLFDQFGRLRVLFFMDENFEGWTLDAAWANTILDLRHRADFEKVAIAGAPVWEEWCVKLVSLLMKGELRIFQRAQLPEAWEWLRAGSAGEGS